RGVLKATQVRCDEELGRDRPSAIGALRRPVWCPDGEALTQMRPRPKTVVVARNPVDHCAVLVAYDQAATFDGLGRVQWARDVLRVGLGQWSVVERHVVAEDAEGVPVWPHPLETIRRSPGDGIHAQPPHEQ